jgi:hypothetical protein
MATYSQNVTRFNDRVVGAIEQVDDALVNAASTAGQWFGNVLPDSIPGAEYLRNLPKPDEYVRLYFDFVEKLVKTQKSFSLNLVKAFQPITSKIWTTQVRKAA